MNITELESKLSSANSEQAMLEIVQQLNVVEQRLLQQIAQGVQPDKFNAMQACANACNIAKNVVQAYAKQGKINEYK